MEHLILTETSFFRQIAGGACNDEIQESYNGFISEVVSLCSNLTNPENIFFALSFAETELQFQYLANRKQRRPPKRLCTQGIVLCTQNAGIHRLNPYQTGMRTTDGASEREKAQSSVAMDRQCHRPCGNDIRHP